MYLQSMTTGELLVHAYQTATTDLERELVKRFDALDDALREAQGDVFDLELKLGEETGKALSAGDQLVEMAAKVRYYEQMLCRADSPTVVYADGASAVVMKEPSIELVADVLRQRDALLAILEEIIANSDVTAELELFGLSPCNTSTDLTDRARAIVKQVRGHHQ